MSAILKFDLKKIIFFSKKLWSKLHKKGTILHVTITFPLNKGKQEHAVGPFGYP